VHIKSHHQWTLANRDFEASPYARFVEESALALPTPAIRLLEYFAVEHETGWLKGAKDIRLLRRICGSVTNDSEEFWSSSFC